MYIINLKKRIESLNQSTVYIKNTELVDYG